MSEDLSTGWGDKKKKSKYYNSKVVITEIIDGKEVTFTADSKLELFTKKLLDDYKIPYEYQFWYELIPTHTNWEGQTVKLMKMIIDFKIVTPSGVTIWLDPKGSPTEEAKMKFKFLSYKETLLNQKYVIKWVKNEFEAANYVEFIYDKYFKK